MDTRKTFDDEKFLIRVFDESYRGRGQIVNTKTEEVFLVIFNNTIKSDGERNKYQPIPKSAKGKTPASNVNLPSPKESRIAAAVNPAAEIFPPDANLALGANFDI